MTRRTLRDAIPELADDIDRLQSASTVRVDGFTHDESPLAGEILAWTIVAFIMGGISAGFLSEAGADLWRQLKMLSSRIFARRRQQTVFQPFDSHRMVTVLILEWHGVQVVISNNVLNNTFVDGRNVSDEVPRWR